MMVRIMEAQPPRIRDIKDLVGRWEATGDQDAGCGLEIVDSSNILLTFQGEKKKIVDYRIDCSHSPCWFDFTIPDTAQVIYVKSLLEVVNDSIIKWELFVDEDRPDHFSSTKGEMFYLRKNPVVQTDGLSHTNQ